MIVPDPQNANSVNSFKVNPGWDTVAGNSSESSLPESVESKSSWSTSFIAWLFGSCFGISAKESVVSNHVSTTPPSIAGKVSDIALQLLGFKGDKLGREQITKRKEDIDNRIQDLNKKPTGFFSIFNGMSKAEKTELKLLQAESSTLGNIQNYTNLENIAKTTLAEIVKSKLPEEVLSKLDSVDINDDGLIVLYYTQIEGKEEALPDYHNLNSLMNKHKISSWDVLDAFEAALLKKIGTAAKTEEVAIPILSEMMRKGVSASGNREAQQLIFRNLGMNLIDAGNTLPPERLEVKMILNMQEDLNQLCKDLEIRERVVYNQEKGIFKIGEQTLSTLDEVYEELSNLAPSKPDALILLGGMSDVVLLNQSPDNVKMKHERLARQHANVEPNKTESSVIFNNMIKPHSNNQQGP